MADRDVLNIEILADGTIKTTTDEVSETNHASAEKFLAILRELTGGEVTTTKRKEAHVHTHGKLTHSH